MHAIDTLIKRTIETRNPTVVGLDPDLHRLPACYRRIERTDNPRRDTADVIPAVKPQIAFYEKYGSYGFAAFEQTVAYAKSRGLVVSTDAKRNHIGNTARAYADGLGAIVDSSRGILYGHMTDDERATCTKEAYLASVRRAAEAMQRDLYDALKRVYEVKY